MTIVVETLCIGGKYSVVLYLYSITSVKYDSVSSLRPTCVALNGTRLRAGYPQGATVVDLHRCDVSVIKNRHEGRESSTLTYSKQYGLSSAMVESRSSSFLSCYLKRIYGNNVYDLCPLFVTLCSY